MTAREFEYFLEKEIMTEKDKKNILKYVMTNQKDFQGHINR